MDTKNKIIKCPKCGSTNIKFKNYLGIESIKCNNCGFDETELYEVFPEQRETQREKAKFLQFQSQAQRA